MLQVPPAVSTMSVQSKAQQPSVSSDLSKGLIGRTIALDLLIRVRTAGAWPWFVFLGVGLLSRAQEPTILRADSIFLFHQAQWVATWLLLGLHLAVGAGKETRLGVTAARASSLVLLLGAIQWLTTSVLDAALPGPADFEVATKAAGSFLLPALPLSIVSMKQVSDQSTPERILRFTVIMTAACLALSSWRLPTHVLASCSAILMIAAAALVHACIAPSPSQPLDENRPRLHDSLDRGSSA